MTSRTSRAQPVERGQRHPADSSPFPSTQAYKVAPDAEKRPKIGHLDRGEEKQPAADDERHSGSDPPLKRRKDTQKVREPFGWVQQ